MPVTPPVNPPVIRMRRATIGYADRAAVKDVDFSLAAHEVVALIGPNGSGKTTLVRGVLGLARLLEGEIELFGRPSGAFSERYRIGYVPQRHTVGGAIPSTVEEVVASGRLPRKRWYAQMNREDRRFVAEAISTVGLSDRHRAAVSTLSGGQQRRVLIARALASQPDVMIMDEPTAGVDVASQDNLVHTLGRLVDQGMTLLVVTHDVRPLLPILTRVVALENGRFVNDATRGYSDAGHDLHHSAAGPDGAADDPVRSPTPGWLGDPGIGSRS